MIRIIRDLTSSVIDINSEILNKLLKFDLIC